MGEKGVVDRVKTPAPKGSVESSVPFGAGVSTRTTTPFFPVWGDRVGYVRCDRVRLSCARQNCIPH